VVRPAHALPLLLVFAFMLSTLPVLPATAHPEACDVTDDEQLDEDCDTGKDGDEGGELATLPEGELELSRDGVGTIDTTRNLHALGFSERSVPLSGPGSGQFNSDLAFWGDLAVQGTYEGFRLVDVAAPDNPQELVNYTDCVVGSGTTGSQGDVVVWDDVLVRSWDAPAPAGGAFCGDVLTPGGQEGVHIFDIGDPTAPEALAFVATPCGSHTASGVPDLDNDRILIYSSPSSNAVACRGIDVIEVPLDDPGAATYLRFVRSGDRGPDFPNLVTIEEPSTAAGAYGATGAVFGPAPTLEGFTGDVVVAEPVEACGPIAEVAAGAVVVVDRGVCGFAIKAANAQAAGAGAVIVANSVPGSPITMGGADPEVTIPSVMVSQADGVIIKAGAPARATISQAPQPATPDRPCHDTGVILGDVLKASCAGGNGVTTFSMDPADGGSLEEPAVLYSRAFEGVTIGHSASFTWDGAVLIFGHEPGGGGQARCQETSAEIDRTLFFLDADTGDTVGTFIHPRPQSELENCTWHNYNVVPTDKRYVMVSGNYQSGVSVVDFTDPTSAREVAFADPAPLSDAGLVTGGDWSTYWYDGHIYQSDIRRGLIIWKLSDPSVAGAKKLEHLNPQTQETSFPFKGTGKGRGGGRA
jgi:hypothetical protein